jgi:hypothetical protein
MSSNRQVNFAGPAAPINGTPNGDNRWSSNSADGRLLQSLIETGVITGMSAKTVQMNYPQFNMPTTRLRQIYDASESCILKVLAAIVSLSSQQPQMVSNVLTRNTVYCY